jgi:hypothetical protein
VAFENAEFSTFKTSVALEWLSQVLDTTERLCRLKIANDFDHILGSKMSLLL